MNNTLSTVLLFCTIVSMQVGGIVEQTRDNYEEVEMDIDSDPESLGKTYIVYSDCINI